MANTGNITVTERDMNPLSPTYDTTRTRTYQDFTRCLPDGIKIYFTDANRGYQYNCDEYHSLRTSDITGFGVGTASVRTASIGNCCTSISAQPTQNSGPEMAIFYGAVRLTTVVMADSVHLIGYAAFSGCTALNSIVMSQNIDTIGIGAFKGCTSMTSFEFSDVLTDIYGEAFNNCTGLTSITFHSTTPPTLHAYANNIFLNTNNCPIYVPSGSVSAYQNDSHWNRVADRIQAIPTP